MGSPAAGIKAWSCLKCVPKSARLVLQDAGGGKNVEAQ